MSDDDLICFCMTATLGEIKGAVRAGHDTIPKLKMNVGCSTGCGTCEERVRKILLETLAEITVEKQNPKKDSA